MAGQKQKNRDLRLYTKGTIRGGGAGQEGGRAGGQERRPEDRGEEVVRENLEEGQ